MDENQQQIEVAESEDQMNREEIEDNLAESVDINATVVMAFGEIACQLADLNGHLRATQLSRRDQIVLSLANGWLPEEEASIRPNWEAVYKMADAMIAASGEGK